MHVECLHPEETAQTRRSLKLSETVLVELSHTLLLLKLVDIPDCSEGIGELARLEPSFPCLQGYTLCCSVQCLLFLR